MDYCLKELENQVIAFFFQHDKQIELYKFLTRKVFPSLEMFLWLLSSSSPDFEAFLIEMYGLERGKCQPLVPRAMMCGLFPHLFHTPCCLCYVQSRHDTGVNC